MCVFFLANQLINCVWIETKISVQSTCILIFEMIWRAIFYPPKLFISIFFTSSLNFVTHENAPRSINDDNEWMYDGYSFISCWFPDSLIFDRDNFQCQWFELFVSLVFFYHYEMALFFIVSDRTGPNWTVRFISTVLLCHKLYMFTKRASVVCVCAPCFRSN